MSKAVKKFEFSNYYHSRAFLTISLDNGKKYEEPLKMRRSETN